jgi:hypothetical protein
VARCAPRNQLADVEFALNMTQIVFEDLASTTDLADVKSEQTRILFAAVPSSLFTVLVCSSILSIAQWQVVDHRTILAWFAMTNLLSLLRLLMFRQFERTKTA